MDEDLTISNIEYSLYMLLKSILLYSTKTLTETRSLTGIPVFTVSISIDFCTLKDTQILSYVSIQKMQMDVKFSTRSIHGRVWDVNTCIQKTVQQKESNADYLCKNA